MALITSEEDIDAEVAKVTLEDIQFGSSRSTRSFKHTPLDQINFNHSPASSLRRGSSPAAMGSRPYIGDVYYGTNGHLGTPSSRASNLSIRSNSSRHSMRRATAPNIYSTPNIVISGPDEDPPPNDLSPKPKPRTIDRPPKQRKEDRSEKPRPPQKERPSQPRPPQPRPLQSQQPSVNPHPDYTDSRDVEKGIPSMNRRDTSASTNSRNGMPTSSTNSTGKDNACYQYSKTIIKLLVVVLFAAVVAGMLYAIIKGVISHPGDVEPVTQAQSGSDASTMRPSISSSTTVSSQPESQTTTSPIENTTNS